MEREILDYYTVEDEIGAGSTSTIYIVSEKATGLRYVCKLMPKAPIDGQEIDVKYLQNEVYALKNLHHPNIAKFIDFFEDRHYFYLVQELCEGKTLLDFINHRQDMFGGIEPITIKHIIWQLLDALRCIHENNIAHRDIKPENIIIGNIVSNTPTIKLIDFGFASLNGKDGLLTTYCGSLQYAAPEILRNKPYVGSKADVWSCGVIFYTMLTGTLPFVDENIKNLIAKIITAQYTIPKEVPDDAKALLKNMLNIDPQSRINAIDALKDPYFYGLSQNDSEKFQRSLPSIGQRRGNIDIRSSLLRRNSYLSHDDSQEKASSFVAPTPQPSLIRARYAPMIPKMHRRSLSKKAPTGVALPKL